MSQVDVGDVLLPPVALLDVMPVVPLELLRKILLETIHISLAAVGYIQLLPVAMFSIVPLVLVELQNVVL